ncbi:hypothetical protein [Coleofasciculus sp. F4-SAH-05]|uniref:hypothetical protein n=1 Tax=Coleofasciculus sp. F4-SAH-05 TaxID=3069525 RepID=UPI0032F0E678
MAKSKNVGYVACPLGFTTRYRDSYADKEKLADCDDNGRCNRCVKTFYGTDIYELTDKDKWPHNNYCTDDEFPPLTKPSDVQLSGGCARKEKRYSWSEEDWIWIVDPMPLDFWSSDIIPGYNQINIYWQGTRYSYYQLKNQPNLVFYLPDRFELIKPEDDTVPDRSKLKFTTPDGSLDNLKATFSFFAQAVVDGDRIDDAKAQIANQIGEEPEMLIFQADKNFRSQLTLRLPNLEGTASQPQVRETAQIDIESGFKDELDLAFPAFQALWNAIFSDGSDTVLFTGDVETKINDGFYKDQIDFIGRFAPEDMEEYYYSIIDSGTDTTYSKALNATTFAEVFDAPPSGTDGQIETLNLDFGENSANLSPSNLEDEITLQRPISDLILGNEDPDVYRYTLKVMRENACNSCAKTANADWIYINQNDTENCQDKCP